MSNAKPETARRPSLVSLLRSIPDLISRLIRDEIRSARLELTTKLKAAALGGGLVVGGIVFGIIAINVLVATAILGLATAVAPWLAALITGVALLVITAILVLIGVNKLKTGVPPVPSETGRSVKRDLQTVKGTRN